MAENSLLAQGNDISELNQIAIDSVPGSREVVEKTDRYRKEFVRLNLREVKSE